MLLSILPFAAAVFSLLLAFASLLAKKRTRTTWWFFAGMAVLGVDSLLTGLTLRATEWPDMLGGLTREWILESLSPAAWLGFSLTYSRGDYRESFARWRLPLLLAALLPIGLSLGFGERLFEAAPAELTGGEWQLRLSAPGKALNAVLLLATVWILVNLEQTFRAAAGTMRWRIKFVILGLGVIFSVRLYAQTQAILFSEYDPRWLGIQASALLIGCVFLTVAYARAGLAGIEVYPSQAVLRSSLTVLICGSYLLIVGVLADLVRRFGGVESFQLLSFITLVGVAGLAALLLSNRLRQRIFGFVGLHFTRAQYDSVRTWTDFSRGLANVKDQAGLSAVSTRLVSETFEALSVTIWLLDEQKEQFIAVASTAPQPGESVGSPPSSVVSGSLAEGLRRRTSPFDLEGVKEPWADELRQHNPPTFSNGGNRWCVPLRTGDRILGALVLADHVNRVDYTAERLQLLQCIADHVTSVLLNLRLSSEAARAREMEAFRTMSAFFVHDLKNAAASLNLMLNNLPVHFDDPAFRQDALRGIGNTARRIDEMIGRLTALRSRPDFKPEQADLNQLVTESLEALGAIPQGELTRDLQALPPVWVDREQIRSVVTNLVMNARDALGPAGRIQLRTEHSDGNVVLSVADNGCGMSAAFVRESLFRPFQSTKRKGLGIGMFQSRMIVEAHGGSIRVESEPGKGSTFRVSLPVKSAT